MRDLVVLVFTFGSAYLGGTRPWLGVLALAVLGYLNPHRYAWGISRSFPVYFIVFVATLIGMISNKKDMQPFPWTRETKLFVILLFWFTLTTSASPDVPNAAQNHWVKVMKIYIGIFPTFFLINSREKLRWLVITIAVSFGLIGLKGGIFAVGTGFSYRVWGPSNTFYGGNNEIALALNMTLPLMILCAKEAERLYVKYFFYGIFIFSICSIVSSWSRGGFLTLCAVLAAMVLTGKRKWIAVPLLIVAVFVLLPKLPGDWIDRMHSIQNYEEDASAMGRIYAWKYAISRANAHLFTGGGFETFRLHDRDVHSAYFEILGEHGYVAFTLWISLLFGTLLALQRVSRLSCQVSDFSWLPPYAKAVQVSLVGYAVGGVFLGAAYWDIFYHLVSLCVIMKVLLNKGIQEQYQLENSQEDGARVYGKNPCTVP